MRFNSPLRYAAVKYLQYAIMAAWEVDRPVYERSSRRPVEAPVPETEIYRTPKPRARYTLSPGQRIFGHTNRPAAVKRNGGVRGSTATRWR